MESNTQKKPYKKINVESENFCYGRAITKWEAIVKSLKSKEILDKLS